MDAASSSTSVGASHDLSHDNSIASVDATRMEQPDLDEYFEVQFSQNGTTYFTPVCPDDMKPVVGMQFSTVEDGIAFYKKYAFACGFEVRHGTCHLDREGKVVVTKYMLCTREGYKRANRNTGQRTRVSNRVGCEAKLMLRFAGNLGYRVYGFEERHTHKLVIESHRQFMKTSRNLDAGHKKFVLDCSKANIGPVTCHRLFKEIVGGYANIGASATDFKNHRRDTLAYLDGSDAQIVINRFLKKKELCPAFCFDYDVDSTDRLTRLFWCDPISRKNFSFFGDVVSCDATYRTNRYDLVFVPFTGLDHHKRCVTFGAGLLLKEDVQSFVWLLENFKKAMVHDPNIIVTDQDPAMKSAIELVFPRSRHRLCMWHIMKKVPGKISHDVTVGDEFRIKLNSIVWSHDLEPSEFESKWLALFNEYNLRNSRWFDDMFALRHHWIPAYFRDVMLGGLVRTTSISEAVNSYFGHFTDRYYRLAELTMHYESGLDSQRHKQSKLNHDSETMVPELKTPLHLEKHASKEYTLSVFHELQEQICAACYSCCIVHMSSENGITVYSIQEGDLNQVTVMQRHLEDEVICSCRMFQRIGLPCRHMLLVFKNLGMNEIPKKYVLVRWTKAATITPIFSINGTVVEQCTAIEERGVMINELISDFYCCLGLLEDNPDRLKQFSRLLKEQKTTLATCSGGDPSGSTSNLKSAEILAGTTMATEVTIFPPDQAKNKGRGKRIKSSREISQAAKLLPKRRCGKCKQYTTHNSRTCTEG